MGLTVEDLDHVTIGLMNDIALEMLENEEDEDGVREATQEDFDAF